MVYLAANDPLEDLVCIPHLDTGVSPQSRRDCSRRSIEYKQCSSCRTQGWASSLVVQSFPQSHWQCNCDAVALGSRTEGKCQPVGGYFLLCSQQGSGLKPSTVTVWRTIAELGEKQSFHKLLTAGQYSDLFCMFMFVPSQLHSYGITWGSGCNSIRQQM